MRPCATPRPEHGRGRARPAACRRARAASPIRAGRRASTPPACAGRTLLPHYASRLPAVELNNTFYARPTAAGSPAGSPRRPPDVPVRRQGPARGQRPGPHGDPAERVPWLTEPLPGFGERLGAVLFRIDAEAPRDDERLAGLLAAWPRTVPLVVEAQHPSGTADETFAALRAAGAALCTTDLDDQRSRPTSAGPVRSCTCASAGRPTTRRRSMPGRRRLVPFLDDGMDAYVLFRHDEVGTSALHAEGFAARDRTGFRGAALSRSGRSPSASRQPAVSPVRRASPPPARTPRRRAASSAMSWKRCGTPGGHEHDSPGPHVADLVAGRDPASCRPGRSRPRPRCAGLLDPLARREHVQPDRQVGHAEQLDPWSAACLLPGEARPGRRRPCRVP